MEKDLKIFGADLESTAVYEELADADVVHVFGEFSFATCAEIEATIVRSVHIGRTNVCNLLGCHYIDAAGIGVLVRAKRAIGDTFSVVMPDTGIVRRVLDLPEIAALVK